jgi:hypothetical protein
VALVITDVSEERIASISRVTGISKLEAALAVTSIVYIFEEFRLLGCDAVWLL